MLNKHKLNNQIKASELRLLGPSGENFGVVSLPEAIAKSLEYGLDLVEISPNATPPVAKIVDYGKFLYSENKKQKANKSKLHNIEIKNIQIKVGTGDNDLALKAKKASEWLGEGNKVRIDLFLPGRSKYMDISFLKERMDRMFRLIAVPFRVAEEPKKSPKGLTSLIKNKK